MSVDRSATLGRFRLLGELGRGGVGVVEAAHDPALRRDVAIKRLMDAADARRTARFIEEAQITAQLQHPNIVPVYELGTDDTQKRPFLAMKRVIGRTLADVVAPMHRDAPAHRLGPQHLRPLLVIFLKICDAIGFAHAKGVIHRDLKPQNIMVGEFGEVLVMDWGLAKPIDAPDDDDTATDTPSRSPSSSAPARPTTRPTTRPRTTPSVATDRRLDGDATVAGAIAGTPAFMAPEQALGGSTLDERTDIFALGGILYFILTTHPPHEFDGDENWLTAVIERRIVPPTRRMPGAGIPRELEAVALKAMARRSAERFANAAELRAEIERFLDGRPLKCVRYHTVARLRKWVQRRPTTAMAAALSMIFFALVGAGVGLWMAETESQARQLAQQNQRLAQQRHRTAQQAEAHAAAEADRLAAEQGRREAQLKLWAQEERFDEIKRAIGVEVVSERDSAIVEFWTLLKDAHTRKVSEVEFLRELGLTRLDRFLAAFERLFTTHELTGLKVTAADYFWFGLLLRITRGDHAAAAKAFDRALEIEPEFVTARINRAATRQSLDDMAGAFADVNWVIEAAPNFAEGFMVRGTMHNELGQYEAAIRDYDQAISLDPNLGTAYLNRATAKRHADDLRGALRDYDRAAVLIPNEAAVFNNRGSVKLALDDLPGAIRDFDRAIALSPLEPHAHHNRALAHVQRGDMDSAIRDFSRTLELDDANANAFAQRGECYRSRRQFAAALRDYDRALALRPDEYLALVGRGSTMHDMGDTTAAMRDFDRAIAIAPDEPEGYFSRGTLVAEQGNYAAALPDFDRAIALDPSVPDGYFNRGTCKRFTGDLPGAAADYEAALRLAPRRWDIRANLGFIYAQLGRRDAAVAAFDRAERDCPPQSRRDLADARRAVLGD